jgi:hypothetical protein
MLIRTMSLILVVGITGCGDDENITPTPPDTNMTTEGFDKTCTADADCTLVFIGNVCGCACTQDAIATGEGSRYSAEQEEKRKLCADILSCQPCPDTHMAMCSGGMCAAVMK